MDFSKVLAAAKCSQAAYIIDPTQAKVAFESLGHTFVSQYKDNDSQAVLSLNSTGATCLSISGTRFSAGKIGDLFDDVQLEPVDVGNGAKVTRGAYESAKQIWEWALKLAPAGTVFNVCGHSLGGWRTAYTPMFIPAAQIGELHAFEPPKGANLAYYQKYVRELARLVIVGNGLDIWFGYPRLGEWMHRPGLMAHLQQTGFQLIDTSKWPGGLSLGDHSINLVVNRLQAIVGAGVPA
ncbi:hypothetical protein FVF58_09725 [Paraburkholderia panacisoli]|uniref:Lipase (Class 3) n=1 Tax=Paraburkholderia panacisoli TaxID=2603818 RepID=A0A5B0HCN7_9BURK|nr:hypothetical protein [Paraburkholderia panacisoli]KAA1013059.1 hypothetical protein FVF58_09725 [Paraburkholderia panacisoli]